MHYGADFMTSLIRASRSTTWDQAGRRSPARSADTDRVSAEEEKEEEGEQDVRMSVEQAAGERDSVWNRPCNSEVARSMAPSPFARDSETPPAERRGRTRAPRSRSRDRA